MIAMKYVIIRIGSDTYNIKVFENDRFTGYMVDEDMSPSTFTKIQAEALAKVMVTSWSFANGYTGEYKFEEV